jgi:hypothetical protein
MLQVMNDSMNKHTQYMDNLFGNDKNLQIKPFYNGFNMNAYPDWRMSIDKKFAQCRMYDRRKIKMLYVCRRKIKIVVSSLTSYDVCFGYTPNLERYKNTYEGKDLST